MKAGPKLDDLVAEKVMGWMKDGQGTWVSKRTFEIQHNCTFSPSTNIQDAWKVIEKIKRKGFNFFVGDADTSEYDCVFGKKGFHRGVAETAPLAICLAALKTFGVDVE